MLAGGCDRYRGVIGVGVPDYHAVDGLSHRDLRFFFADGAVDVVDAESVDEDVVDAESVDEDVSGFDGLADATNGIANMPAPIPRATANAPTRPIYLACPMFVYLALLIFGLPRANCADVEETTPS
jgi:hypothetical protein